jgi:hypothetical protein
MKLAFLILGSDLIARSRPYISVFAQSNANKAELVENDTGLYLSGSSLYNSLTVDKVELYVATEPLTVMSGKTTTNPI